MEKIHKPPVIILVLKILGYLPEKFSFTTNKIPNIEIMELFHNAKQNNPQCEVCHGYHKKPLFGCPSINNQTMTHCDNNICMCCGGYGHCITECHNMFVKHHKKWISRCRYKTRLTTKFEKLKQNDCSQENS